MDHVEQAGNMEDMMEAFGALNEYAKGDAEDWENVRDRAEQAVAEEAENESKR